MNPLRRRDAVLWSSLLGAVATAGAARSLWADSPHSHGRGSPRSGAASDFARDMDQSMATMMQAMDAPAYTGDPDMDFLAMMIPHHQGAVDMARLVLQHGKDPVTRQLAEEIIAGQAIEIASMGRRLALLGQDICTTEGEFPALGGTRGP